MTVELTPQELQEIEKRAEELYPVPFMSASYGEYMAIVQLKRAVYIAAATYERKRAKSMVYALEEVIKWADGFMIDYNEGHPILKAKLLVNTQYNQSK